MEHDFSKFPVGDFITGFVIGVTNVDVLDYSRGKYLQITFTDGYGVRTAKKWSYREDVDELPIEGEAYLVEGHVKEYNGSRYLDLANFKKAPSEFKKALTPQAPFSAEELRNDVEAVVSKITDASMQSFTRLVLSKFADEFFIAPAAVGVHHNYQGGLAHHSLEVVEYAERVAESSNYNLNKDLVIMGALLHDIGKTKCYCIKNFAPSMTVCGKLNDHIVVGVGMLYRLMYEWCLINKITEVPKWFDYLVHIVASHHENLEWGSPVKPAFEEALIVARADNLSASLTSMSKSIDEIDTDDGFSKKRDFKFGTFLNKPYFREGDGNNEV